MEEQRRYTVELKPDERVEEFGRCYVPKLIMKQEKLFSGMTVVLQSVVNNEVRVVTIFDI